MDKPNNFPPNFNPAAAILLDEITLTLKLNTRTGQVMMTTSRPDMNFLVAIGILAAQIQGIVDGSLKAAAAGTPGFTPPGGFGAPGGNPGENTGGKPGENAK